MTSTASVLLEAELIFDIVLFNYSGDLHSLPSQSQLWPFRKQEGCRQEHTGVSAFPETEPEMLHQEELLERCLFRSRV